MASIQKDVATGTYKVRYRKPDRGTTTKRGFKTKRDAELWLADNTVKQAKGDFINVSAGKVTVSELGEEWLQNVTHIKPSTLRPTRARGGCMSNPTGVRRTSPTSGILTCRLG